MRGEKFLTVDLEGFDGLEAVIVQLPRATAKRVSRQAMIATLEPVARDMAAKAPRLSGALEKSVGVGTKLTRSQKKYGGFNGGRKAEDTLTVHAGPGGLPQALIQEIGSFKEPPQPYVRPAWDSHKGKLVGRLAKELGPKVMSSFETAAAKGKLR